jgi:hypothetical protein
MRALFTIAVALVLTVGVQAGIQQDRQQTQSSVAGKWDLSFQTKPSVIYVLEIKVEGKTVTGTLSGPQGSEPLKGEIGGGKLTFVVPFESASGPEEANYSADLKPDDTLAGSVIAPEGGIDHMVNWTAVRSKEK